MINSHHTNKIGNLRYRVKPTKKKRYKTIRTVTKNIYEYMIAHRKSSWNTLIVIPLSCVSCVPVSCVLIWFVSCPCYVSLWVNYCPAVFVYYQWLSSVFIVLSVQLVIVWSIRYSRSSCLSGLPCRAVPCRAVPCRALPCLAVPCRAVPCLTCLFELRPCLVFLSTLRHVSRSSLLCALWQ